MIADPVASSYLDSPVIVADSGSVADVINPMITVMPGPVVRAEFSPSSGVFQVVGTDRNDRFRIIEAGGYFRIEIYQIVDPISQKGEYRPMSIQTPDGPVSLIDGALVKEIEVYGWGGKDNITFEYSAEPPSILLAPRPLRADLLVQIFGGMGDD
jgi:hypothetical protein